MFCQGRVAKKIGKINDWIICDKRLEFEMHYILKVLIILYIYIVYDVVNTIYKSPPPYLNQRV